MAKSRLPTVVSPIPRDLRTFLDRVREMVDTGALASKSDVDAAVRRALDPGQPGGYVGGAPVEGWTPGADGEITPIPPRCGTTQYPSAPTGVAASGAFTTIILTWDDAPYCGHAYTEIWAAPSSPSYAPEDQRQPAPTQDMAVKIGQAPYGPYSHAVAEGSAYCYWLRHVNVNGTAGAFHSVEGTCAETSRDPAYLLDLLEGQITESQLYQDLRSRIELIDGPVDELGSVNQRLQALNDTIVNGVTDIAVVTETGATTLRAIKTSVEDAHAAIIDERTVRLTEDEALATSISGLTTRLGAAEASIVSEQTTRASEDEALATSISGLSARLGTAEGAIASEATARASADGALAQDISEVVARVGDAEADITNMDRALVGYCSRGGYSTKASCEAAGGTWLYRPFAESVKQVTVSDGESTATVEQMFQAHQDDLGHLYGQYTLKIDNNGHVSGFGISSGVSSDGIVNSSFIINADDFSVASPYGDRIPFVVRTTGTTINGEYVPPGVYIQDAMIANGTITSAKIADATIDSAKISDLTATKITSGSISVGTSIQSASYSAGNYGWKIEGNGNARFENVYVRGTVEATYGWFKGSLFGGSATSFSSGTGFFGGLTGSTYRWRVGNPYGGRIEWDGSNVKIYSGSNRMIFSSGSDPDWLTQADLNEYAATRLGDLAGMDAITDATYISAGVFDDLLANNLAASNGYIDNLRVGTLNIDGDAVIVPAGLPGDGYFSSPSIYLNVGANVLVMVTAYVENYDAPTGCHLVVYVNGDELVNIGMSLDEDSGTMTAIGARWCNPGTVRATARIWYDGTGRPWLKNTFVTIMGIKR